jgi:hypothetical protein
MQNRQKKEGCPALSSFVFVWHYLSAIAILLPVASSTLVLVCFYPASGLLSPFPNKSRTRVKQE